jgi:DNA-binding beta-propeller fold protein YncE
VIDTATSRVLARPSLTTAGLSSIATARGLAYAVNTATHELAVLNPGSQTIDRYALSQEPAAVAASEDTGAVYVLSSRASMIVRIDPTDGSEIGRAVLPDRSGHAGLAPQNTLTMRPRLAISQTDETLFATLPEAGTLAAVGNDQYPVIAREIPWPDQTGIAVAAEVPEVLSPAAAQSGSAQALAISH